MHPTLNVYLHKELIGTLTLASFDRSLFAFTQDYIANPDRRILSLGFKDHLGSLRTQFRLSRAKLLPFFSNLLPEDPLRAFLANRAGVNPAREFQLLAALGEDLPGAVTVLPA